MQQANEQLAAEVLSFVQDRLTMLIPAIYTPLQACTMEQGLLCGTDGSTIHYEPNVLLQQFKQGTQKVERSILHSLFHCLFQHTSFERDDETWHLATDIAVEASIISFHIASLQEQEDAKRTRILSQLRCDIQYLTAERIYHYFKTHTPPTEWTILFHRDEHLLWASAQQENSKANQQVVEQTWHRVLEKFEAQLTMAQMEASTIRHNIERIQQPSYDYESMLKQFASVYEEMKLNEDEFDYIFYTYGLQMYDNIPLVEPLEYQEVLRIKEFVIVIDTSGSCEEELVSRFLTQTYQILRKMTIDNRQVAIRIIQCDDTVQSDKVITSMAELEAYMEYEPLSGFGNTDFEAAFLYVEQLIEEGAFYNLAGLLYFTDGEGHFPSWVPSVQSLFIFLDNGGLAPKVPTWAFSITLPFE